MLTTFRKDLTDTEEFIRSSQKSVTTLTSQTISEMQHRIELLNKDKEILSLQNELAKHERNNLGQRIVDMEGTIIELSKQLGNAAIHDPPAAVIHIGPLQSRLQSIYVSLSDSLYVDSVLAYLYQERVFSSETNEDITNLSGQHKKARALLNALQRLDDNAVKVFIHALIETEQSHLAEYFKD